MDRPIFLATRGSALALAQTNLVLAACRTAFPAYQFEANIIRTTGDKLQTAPPDVPAMPGTKGLFTKELEVALLNGEADLAVHSLKDLPTDLPDGLQLCATLPRADVRDVLIYREGALAGPHAPHPEAKEGAELFQFASGATVATSSTRRQAQVQALRPDLKVVPIRGNVGTRLQKLADRADLDGLVLAAAGLRRLHFQIAKDGSLSGPVRPGEKNAVPNGLRVAFLPVADMLPCVGQGAIGLEGRAGDSTMRPIFEHLNDAPTFYCVTAERAFLRAMGGGCLSPVAAYATIVAGEIHLQAVSFRDQQIRRTERRGPLEKATELGALAADDVKA